MNKASPTGLSLSERALRNAALGSSFLVVLKAVGFVMTGSLLVLGSLLDSIADTVTSVINFKVSKFAKLDPDQEHPFGHGGFEVAASLTQGFVIVFFGINLFIEASRRLINSSESSIDVKDLGVAIVILLASAVGGIIIQKILSNQIKANDSSEERSLALEADEAHYMGDVISNIMAAAGLGLVYATGNKIFDAVFAIISAVFLIRAAYPILKKCYVDIVHQEAEPRLQQKIVDLVLSSDDRIRGIHQLRSRELGPILFVDFHMSLDGNISLNLAHGIGDRVEARIKKELPRADVIIHLDPDDEPEHNGWDVSYEIDG